MNPGVKPILKDSVGSGFWSFLIGTSVQDTNSDGANTTSLVAGSKSLSGEREREDNTLKHKLRFSLITVLN